VAGASPSRRPVVHPICFAGERFYRRGMGVDARGTGPHARALTGGAGGGASERLTEQHVAVLSHRLAGNEEAALQRAYDLGRQALDDGLGALEIALMHQEALLTVLREHPEESLQVSQAATAVLLEVLAPIEMARRGFEARLLEAERLAGIGSLLSAAAHELSNPLEVISGNVALLREAAEGEPAAAQVESIAEAGEHCDRIVDSLLELARRHPPGRQMVSLNEIIQGALPLLSYQFRIHEVDVALDLSPDLPRLWADPHQLRQVVVSLSANADQAMRHTPPPRRLRVATRPLAPGSVLLEVADSGPGLPPDHPDRIFQPGVTARPVGEGTGLGLPVCRRIVEWHGGALLAESAPGQGAVFRIELPVGTMPMESARAAILGRRILIVVDEPQVATVLAEILTLEGHHVDIAPHGLAALAKLREHPYELIMSDVRMPDLDGPGLYRELLRREPELARRFIFIMGDVRDRNVAAFVKATGARCLRKPFLPDEVRRLTCEA
jgi:signal transduction histidine kinase